MSQPEANNGHDVNSATCWCNPDIYQLCPMCGGDDEGCPYCIGQTEINGLVWQYCEEQPSIIVHQDI